ncbi:MAG: ABC transporter permease [Planctomycetes bacterium]|nr:ABC transporter permease [Planctomycetota bacterium]
MSAAHSERLSPRAFWSGVHLVAARELGAAFDSGIATIATIALTLLASSIFMNEFFLTGTVDMTPFFDLLPLLLAFFLPALSMRLWAEEKKSRTIELLFTLPIRPLQAVLGKYLAALALYGLFLACTLPIPVMLCALGAPDLGAIASGYLGLVAFGALFLAFGGLLSALARDQIVAFVTSTLVGFAFVLSGEERAVSVLDGLFPALSLGSFLREHLSVLVPYGEFVRGVVRLSAGAYFVLLSGFFLWATALVLERDRA